MAKTRFSIRKVGNWAGSRPLGTRRWPKARSLISQEALTGVISLDQRIDVEDGFGNLQHRLNFVDAIEIRKPAG